MWMWPCIIGGAVILVVLGVWWIARLISKGAKGEIKQDIAEEEAERRAEDAKIASKPMRERPFTGPGGLFDK